MPLQMVEVFSNQELVTPFPQPSWAGSAALPWYRAVAGYLSADRKRSSIPTGPLPFVLLQTASRQILRPASGCARRGRLGRMAGLFPPRCCRSEPASNRASGSDPAHARRAPSQDQRKARASSGEQTSRHGEALRPPFLKAWTFIHDVNRTALLTIRVRESHPKHRVGTLPVDP
jgi:hypothetical protein